MRLEMRVTPLPMTTAWIVPSLDTTEHARPSSRASMQSFCTTVSADTPVGENSMRTPRAGRLGRSLEILPAPSNTITAS